MIDAIIGFSIRNKLIVAVCVAALAIWGVYSLLRLPLDAVPDVTNNQVQVITRSPSLAPLEIERYISAPVEYATATIPGLVEVRSISRFGLSVVTLVFNDDVDVYWARTQVSERLQQVQTEIPAGYGTPVLAPVSTGLGEVYQYVLRPENPADTSYSLMELRTMQDWIVRLKLLGTDGVADVSSFGGYVKEYQAKLDPALLRAAGVTLQDVFTALEQGSGNTGATYIEKEGQSLFVRGLGLVTSLEDLGNIVVSNPTGRVPVLVKDVGRVEYGYATRYGALTLNGKPAVGGIVLMRKGANSREVIANVKARMAQIQQVLPKGVVIEAFLDRAELVSRTISTVGRNLLEGGLIVIFVLVLLLGNLRAGIVVASVIPLAMLFAFGMMNTFGVSGNLMSLGAIDFGLIVDGAVIIVENVVRHISDAVKARSRQAGVVTALSRSEMDETVFGASREIRKSAAFGEIIILIVYIPLLSLQGVEGKMFQPMALTVGFAILGALILSLTYVPMMSALALSRKTQENHEGLSERIIRFFYQMYEPAIMWALRFKKTVVAVSLFLLAASAWLFMRMGGEFIPQLDEGDYAIDFRLPPGTSLTRMAEVCQDVSRQLLTEFPDEIKTVVTKIGNSEIPTDPMAIEAGDFIVVLKPATSWTKVRTKEELTERVAAFLQQVPGAYFSVQQPIQMRFNELISGAKSDVVIKLFGPELNVLAHKGEQIGKLIERIDGVKDVYVQRIEGLPLIEVQYNRRAMAAYGVTVKNINDVLQAAFAGRVCGVVFEGDRRFALSVRLDEPFRKSPDDIEQLLITTQNGTRMPLGQLGRVAIVSGPAEIGRESSQRRIAINFNVRGRDVQSAVAEIQAKLASKLVLPPGYSLDYGGQFENLQRAKTRLLVVVPLALALIFTLLFFTFNSVVETLMIFSAIPLAAVGGVLALWLRGMPFSISAGVGFIALSGVAVLNGIVLISYFNQLRDQGFATVHARILHAVQVRFRPVIMTALVASLGFLPMALGTGAGAEVQKPLATVVIGGLVTATLLTLVVLPAIYALIVKDEPLKRDEYAA
jgi:cobalt-zinc-cadmium resistance protein CzcA